VNRRQQQSGQVLILFAGGMIGLLALLALALDLSSVYSLQRMERSTADAAALAGAQDLKTPGSRAVGPADYRRARTDALRNLASKLGATSDPSCLAAAPSTDADIVNCDIPGTPYRVSIKTPSPSALDVEPSRAVMVTVGQLDVPLTIAHLFGQHDWNVAQTSVAGIGFAGKYAVITLRPPVSGRTGNTGDISINGTGSGVDSIDGDIGMNTGATLNGHSATVDVPDGFYVRYYGASTDQSTPPGPTAYKQLRLLIADPAYPIPVRTGALMGGTDASATCAAAKATVVTNGYLSAADAAGAVCYKPGIYSAQFKTKNTDTFLLEPGVYFFDGGIDNQGILIGGYGASTPGVALVIPQTQNFTMTGGGGGSANVIALNRGSAYDLRSGGVEATAALTVGGVPVQTNTTPPMIMSVIVPGDPLCTVTVPAPSCTDSTINWSGSGSATITAVAGVTYAPSDNIAVAGNSDPKGYIGQLVAWTITYSGGSTLNQHYPGAVGNGFVRLDTACSGGTSPCSP
jgi:Putative Flp pilus-assembly TadE/G-like